MIGVLFGAGASFGSQEKESPPLGGALYEAIKSFNVGPRRQVKKDVLECLSVVQYLDPSNTKITQSITIDEWVASVSLESQKYFLIGDFENGLATLSNDIQSQREARVVKKGTSMMMLGDEELDIALPEKIMRSVAEYLYPFTPSKENLYRDIIEVLPDESQIFTLNYDSLLEIIAFEKRINLIEPETVRKTHLSHPAKSLGYIQLHGGITLCSTWDHHRVGLPGLISHSNVERVNRISHISDQLWFNLDIETYRKELKGLAALSFYNPEKTNVIGPDVIKKFHETYSEMLENGLDSLIVIGCRHTPHDHHLWEPVEKFSGRVYWCGSLPTDQSFCKKITHIGTRFGNSMDEIMKIIK